MKRWIALVVLCCGVGLLLVGTASANNPPDQVIGSGHAVLTMGCDGGGAVGEWQIDFKCRAWEAYGSRPAGGWQSLKVMDGSGVALAEYTSITFTHVGLDPGVVRSLVEAVWIPDWTWTLAYGDIKAIQ